MITRINQKNKNNKKGMTILYALFGILIFTIVGVVIFNSSTANYVRAINEHDNEQAYLTVSSATDVFVNSIVGDKVTYTIVEKRKGDVLIEQTSPEDIVWTYVDTDKQNPVKDILLEFVKKRYANESESIIENYTITPTFDDEEIKMEDVYLTTVLDNYDIIATFSNWDKAYAKLNNLEDVDDADKPKNYFYIIATISFVRDNHDYYSPVVEKVETTEEEDTDGSIIDITTTTYKVEWDTGNVSIVRGKTDE